MSSVPSTQSPTLKTTPASQLLTVAEGCFWGTEHVFRKYYTDKGLVDCKVGYLNGVTTAPLYKEVCTGTTNHAEALQVSFDPLVVSLKELVRFFYLTHDPTQLNHQGADTGTQYRSAIFYHQPEDAAVIAEVQAEVQAEFYPNHKIVTVVEPIKLWFDAEDYHQLYLEHNPDGYQCPTHFLRTTPQK